MVVKIKTWTKASLFFFTVLFFQILEIVDNLFIKYDDRKFRLVNDESNSIFNKQKCRVRPESNEKNQI